MKRIRLENQAILPIIDSAMLAWRGFQFNGVMSDFFKFKELNLEKVLVSSCLVGNKVRYNASCLSVLESELNWLLLSVEWV